MSTFSLRPYCRQTDLDILSAQRRIYDLSISVHRFRGRCPYHTPEETEDLLLRCTLPPVVASPDGSPIGTALLLYDGDTDSYRSHVALWEHQEWTQQVLARQLDNLFAVPGARMVVCRVGGFERHLLDACHALSLAQAGCVDNAIRCLDTLWPQYTFCVSAGEWLGRSADASLLSRRALQQEDGPILLRHGIEKSWGLAEQFPLLFPPVIADANNRAIGFAAVYDYDRSTHSYHFHLSLWEQEHCMIPLLRQLLADIFARPNAHTVICTAAGHEENLLSACRFLGMTEAVCLPAAVRFRDAFQSLHTMVMTRRQAEKQFDSD